MTINEVKYLPQNLQVSPAAVSIEIITIFRFYTLPNYLGISRQKWDSIVAIHLIEVAEANLVFTDMKFEKSTRTLTFDYVSLFSKISNQVIIG